MKSEPFWNDFFFPPTFRIRYFQSQMAVYSCCECNLQVSLLVIDGRYPTICPYCGGRLGSPVLVQAERIPVSISWEAHKRKLAELEEKLRISEKERDRNDILAEALATKVDRLEKELKIIQGKRVP